jgi:hypothetical protein
MGVVSCPDCGGTKLRLKDRRQRCLRHESWGVRRCVVELETRKWLCRVCGRSFWQGFPGIQPRLRATEPFRRGVCQKHFDGMNRSHLGRREGISSATIERWFCGIWGCSPKPEARRIGVERAQVLHALFPGPEKAVERDVIRQVRVTHDLPAIVERTRVIPCASTVAAQVSQINDATLLPHHRMLLNRGGINYGSRDGNPNDRTHGTFFQILPTPRTYARFPFFNMMNTRDDFAELILRPRKSLVLRTDVHAIELASAADLWYTGVGVYQPWTFG